MSLITSATLTIYVTVVAGNWFRGLAGDSTAYPPGSSVSIPPFSVAFGLHCICLLWLSVHVNESSLCEGSTRFCDSEGFCANFRLMLRSLALSSLGHSIAVLGSLMSSRLLGRWQFYDRQDLYTANVIILGFQCRCLPVV